MPRYFFNIEDRYGVVFDPEGVVLPDVVSARQSGVAGIRDMIAEDVKSGVLDLSGTLTVADDTGNTVLTLPYDAAFVRRVV